MSYRDPHHSRRDRIVDLEVMRLELGKTRLVRAFRPGIEQATVSQLPRAQGSTRPPEVA